MKIDVLAAVLAVLLLGAPVSARSESEPLCKPLRNFLASVGPNEHREIIFRTAWGGGFKDDPETRNSIASKRCEYRGYGKAKPVCDVLMNQGSAEFGNVNAMGAVVCISPDIRFQEDPGVGGMALKIVADGY